MTTMAVIRGVTRGLASHSRTIGVIKPCYNTSRGVARRASVLHRPSSLVGGHHITHATKQHDTVYKLMSRIDSKDVSSLLLCGVLAAGLFFTAADWSMAATSSAGQYDLAENEDFWANVLRYVSYFFSVLLGTAYVAFKPILELLKRPTTAVLVILATLGLYFFVSTTVTAMLGVEEFEYEPSSIVTPYVVSK
mmetsp:Transcript_9579/g.18996  ORF Transcript_9579/g.18996 Transcript_9579/m.18996 type:complete len:193 (+) Transcript_9579:720-1298(+)